MCHVSHVISPPPHKLVKLVNGESVINGAYPSSFKLVDICDVPLVLPYWITTVNIPRMEGKWELFFLLSLFQYWCTAILPCGQVGTSQTSHRLLGSEV